MSLCGGDRRSCAAWGELTSNVHLVVLPSPITTLPIHSNMDLPSPVELGEAMHLVQDGSAASVDQMSRAEAATQANELLMVSSTSCLQPALALPGA